MKWNGELQHSVPSVEKLTIKLKMVDNDGVLTLSRKYWKVYSMCTTPSQCHLPGLEKLAVLTAHLFFFFFWRRQSIPLTHSNFQIRSCHLSVIGAANTISKSNSSREQSLLEDLGGMENTNSDSWLPNANKTFLHQAQKVTMRWKRHANVGDTMQYVVNMYIEVKQLPDCFLFHYHFILSMYGVNKDLCCCCPRQSLQHCGQITLHSIALKDVKQMLRARRTIKQSSFQENANRSFIVWVVKAKMSSEHQ